MDDKPRRTLRESADEAAAMAADMDRRVASALGAERKELKGRARMLRDLERWYRSRNGYE